MTTFPVTTKSILERIRNEVPKPANNMLIMCEGLPRFYLGLCPMGLLSSAYTEAPEHVSDFKPNTGFSTKQILLFGKWWDSHNTTKKAREARDFIWDSAEVNATKEDR